MLVPGIIAATFAASVMKVPADVAVAPRGVTKTMVGTVAFSIAWMMSWVDETRPPGVELDQDRRSFFGLGLLDRPDQIVGARRIDRAVDRHDEDVACEGRREDRASQGPRARTHRARLRPILAHRPLSVFDPIEELGRHARLRQQRQLFHLTLHSAKRRAPRSRRPRSPHPSERCRSPRSGRSPCARACRCAAATTAWLAAAKPTTVRSPFFALISLKDVRVLDELAEGHALSLGHVLLLDLPSSAFTGRKSATAAALTTIALSLNEARTVVAHLRAVRTDAESTPCGVGPRSVDPRRRAALVAAARWAASARRAAAAARRAEPVRHAAHRVADRLTPAARRDRTRPRAPPTRR